MLGRFSYIILLIAVSDRFSDVSADVNPVKQDAKLRPLEQLPCNKNHDHVNDELTAILEGSGGNVEKSGTITKRFINQFSSGTHILTQEEFEHCKNALSILDDRNTGDGGYMANDAKSNDGQFYYKSLRRSGIGGGPANVQLDIDNDENRASNSDNENPVTYVPHGVMPVPTVAGAPLANYDYSRRMMLLKNKRVCYACSSASNPTCEHPDRSTTIKYCSADQDACVIKSYKTQDTNTNVIVRDCASSCNEPDPLNISPKYKKCSICRDDLCNAAYFVDHKTALLIGSIYALFALYKSM